MSFPGTWLLSIGFKVGYIDTQIGDSLLKHIYTESDEMSIEEE